MSFFESEGVMSSTSPTVGETERRETELEASASSAEWREDVPRFVGETSIILAVASGLLKVKAVDKRTRAVFDALFDTRKLVGCGFHERIGIENIVKILRSALRGGESLCIRIIGDSTDAIKLKVTQEFPGFELDYILPLSRRPLEACEQMRNELEAAKTEISMLQQTKEQLEAELACEKFATDARVEEMQKVIDGLKIEKQTLAAAMGGIGSVTHFRFATSLRKEVTLPEHFRVTADGKTAARSRDDYCAQILLEPALVGDGIHAIEFRIEELKGCMAVGLTEDCGEWVHVGCSFNSLGDVSINEMDVFKAQAFKGWKKLNRIKLTVDLDRGKVCIEAPNGQLTVDWKPPSRHCWFGFYLQPETVVSIVPTVAEHIEVAAASSHRKSTAKPKGKRKFTWKQLFASKSADSKEDSDDDVCSTLPVTGSGGGKHLVFADTSDRITITRVRSVESLPPKPELENMDIYEDFCAAVHLESFFERIPPGGVLDDDTAAALLREFSGTKAAAAGGSVDTALRYFVGKSQIELEAFLRECPKEAVDAIGIGMAAAKRKTKEGTVDFLGDFMRDVDLEQVFRSLSGRPLDAASARLVVCTLRDVEFGHCKDSDAGVQLLVGMGLEQLRDFLSQLSLSDLRKLDRRRCAHFAETEGRRSVAAAALRSAEGEADVCELAMAVPLIKLRYGAEEELLEPPSYRCLRGVLGCTRQNWPDAGEPNLQWFDGEQFKAITNDDDLQTALRWAQHLGVSLSVEVLFT